MQNVPDFFQFQKDQDQMLQSQYMNTMPGGHVMNYPAHEYRTNNNSMIESKMEDDKNFGQTRRSTRTKKTPQKFRSSLLLDDEEEIGMIIKFLNFSFYSHHLFFFNRVC